MDNKLIILFFASVILSGVHSVNVKQTNRDITVREGDSYDLLCEALDAEVKACAFITPYGKTYVLWPGANYENGRVKQQGDKSGQCGLTVDKAKDTDNGKWQCNLSVQGQGGNAIAETRDVSVTVAVPPTTVALKIEESLSPSFYNVKMKQNPKEKKELLVDCIAEQARPKPTFEWWLGGEPLAGQRTSKEENEKAGKADYVDTLKYYPSENHDGKKLRCQVTHRAYTEVQKTGKENEAEVLLKIQYPPVPAKKAETHYNLNLGKANTIRMQFNANPKPSEGYWTINNTKVQIGTKSKDSKYTSGTLTAKDGIQGQWLVELTIKDLTADDTKGTHKLTIKNEEGETNYDFKLALGKQPPPANGPAAESNSLTVGIIVIIVIIVLILVIVIIARAKGMLCFAAAKGGDELDEEKEAFENVEKGESNAIVQESKPVETNLSKGTPEKKLDQEVETKAEKEEKKSNGAHTPV